MTVATNITVPDEQSPSDRALDARRAIRFLHDHRLGRLITDDPSSGEPHVTPVHFVSDGGGGFVTHLPAGSAPAEAIARGGATWLSVQSDHVRLHGEASDDVSLWHVQAQVEAELLSDEAAISDALARQLGEPIEAVSGGGAVVVDHLVAARLRVISVSVRQRSR